MVMSGPEAEFDQAADGFGAGSHAVSEAKVIDRLDQRLRHRRDDALGIGLIHAGTMGSAKCMSTAHIAPAERVGAIGQPSLFAGL
jgi:hypothetical protein